MGYNDSTSTCNCVSVYCLIIFNFFFFFGYSSSLEVDIINTATATSNLKGWIIHTYINGVRSNSALYGWKEQSCIQANVTNRGFRICPNKQNASIQFKIRSWLFSPFILFTEASRIYIELQFSMRECQNFHDAICRETFKVYYHPFKNFSETNSSLNYQLYTSIDTIAAESKFNPNDKQKAQAINIETVSFSLSQLKNKRLGGVRVAIVDEGACVELSSIRIYYKVCPAITSHLAFFPKAKTGPHKTSLIEMAGKCVADSSLVSSHFNENQTTPLYHCTSSGQWNVRTGQCLCNPGFQADDQHLSCIKCPLNSYKSIMGNEKCIPCPSNSFTDETGATSCRCSNLNHQFESTISIENCERCARLPSPPIKLTVANEQRFSKIIYLKWLPPIHKGHCKSIQYCIICQSCINNEAGSLPFFGIKEMKLDYLANCNHSHVLRNSSNYVMNGFNCDGLSYFPQRCEIDRTAATIYNLNPFLSYRFTVLAVNSVTINRYSEFRRWSKTSGKLQEKSNGTIQNFTLTQQLKEVMQSSGVSVTYRSHTYPPSAVTNLSIVESKNSRALINWSPPAESEETILQYQVRWSLVSRSALFNTTATLFVNSTSVTLSGLEPMSLYYVTVRAFNSAGFGNFCNPLLLQLNASDLLPLTTASTIVHPAQQNLYIAATLTFALLIVCCFLIIYGKKILRCGKVISTLHPPEERSNNQTSVTDLSTDAHRTYVDPFHLRILQPKFDCETDPDHVTTMSVIGCGEFGEVYRGTLIKKDSSGQGNEMIIDVAVKQLRAQCEPHEQFDFLREATALSRFRHPNIVRLEAVVTESRPFMIVTELMKHGCLSAFLKRHGQAGLAFPPLILVRMMKGVAMGMEYLSHLNYVHRDLAARNVLINDDLVCKVADFGLTQHLDENYHCLDDVNALPLGQGGKIAIRWSAPEAIAHGAYSQASDVWSFGVLAWEITTYGEKPYWNLTNKQVFQAINDGFRLPASEDCPALLHQLMLECWHCDRRARPSFARLVAKLDHVIDFPDVLCELAGPASTGADEFSYPNPAKRSCSSVVERSRDYGEATTSDFPNDCSSLEAPGTISSNVTIDALISNAERFELPSLDCMVVDPTETHALLERRSFSTDLSIESRDDEAQQYTQTSC